MRTFKPEELRCYDNGGRSFDRYTILPPRWAGDDWRDYGRTWQAIAASERPYHPQGFGQSCTAVAGHHLGKKIPFSELPGDVQKFARATFCASLESNAEEA